MESQRWKPDFGEWRVNLVRAVAGGLGSILTLIVAGWPDNTAEAAWVGLGGLVVGLSLAFGAEYIARLRHEVGRLHAIERELAQERRSWARERKLRDHQLALAKAEAAINAVGVEVWGGAFNEAQRTGQLLPFSAINARLEMLMKAKNLDKPIPPPRLDDGAPADVRS